MFATLYIILLSFKGEAKAVKEGIPLNCPHCKMWIPVGAKICGHCAKDIF